VIHGRLLQSAQAIIALRRMAADRAARLRQGAIEVPESEAERAR